MLNSLYELILLISRTINANVHLKFRLYDKFFEHFNKIETTIQRNNCFFKIIIVKACEAIIEKFVKYYFKTKNKNDTIYNIANILNFTCKLKFYKM